MIKCPFCGIKQSRDDACAICGYEFSDADRTKLHHLRILKKTLLVSGLCLIVAGIAFAVVTERRRVAVLNQHVAKLQAQVAQYEAELVEEKKKTILSEMKYEKQALALQNKFSGLVSAARTNTLNQRRADDELMDFFNGMLFYHDEFTHGGRSDPALRLETRLARNYREQQTLSELQEEQNQRLQDMRKTLNSLQHQAKMRDLQQRLKELDR